MSRNGSGVYSLVAGNPVVTGTTISSTTMNNTLNDIASALTGSLAADGQTLLTGNLNANSNKVSNLANPTLAQDSATKYYVDNATYLQGGTGSVIRTIQNKLQESVSVKDFGAIGNGTTDDTIAIQNAITYCYANNLDLYIPTGTYKLTTYLIWNGCNIYGDGEGNTIINGAPDCDVFFTPDYSIAQTGSVANPRQNAHVSDMSINVNNSGTQVYPNGTFNRPIYPIIANWSSSLVVIVGQYYLVPGIGVYKCFSAGTTSSTPPSTTAGTQIDGTVTWLYVDSQQRYVGNAGFAAPIYNGATSPSSLLHWVFKNIRITASGSLSNLSTACFYSQNSFYDCTFENQIWRYTAYGFLNVPPTTNFQSIEFSPDADIFNKIAIYCAFPFISFNNIYSTIINMQCYSDLNWRSLYLLGYKGLDRSSCLGWNLVNFYCEPNSGTNGALGFIDGNSHIISGGTLKAAYGRAYYVFVGNSSTIQSNFIGNDGTFSVLLLLGNFNIFSSLNTASNTLNNLIDDRGLGNICEFSYSSSYVTESERQLMANPGTVRNPYGIRQNDWLVKNCATTPFYDMLFGGREFITHNATAINLVDSNLETGGYVRMQDGLGWYSQTANRQPLAIGSRIPAGKVQFLVKGRLSVTTTATISLLAVPTSGPNVNLGSITPTWSTNWNVFELDVDLSAYAGYTLQLSINNPASTSAYLDVAWVAIVPFAPANTIVKNQFFSGIVDLEGTGSPNSVVTANPGSTYRNISGGSGTSFYVKESGTGNTGWVGK